MICAVFLHTPQRTTQINHADQAGLHPVSPLPLPSPPSHEAERDDLDKDEDKDNKLVLQNCWLSLSWEREILLQVLEHNPCW
jgi:hypothetical protein